MRIGIDIDGVLADFVFGFAALARRQGFKPPYSTHANSPEFAHGVGLTDTDADMVWKEIRESHKFWAHLPSLIPQPTWHRLRLLALRHDVYFMTMRTCGWFVKRQTELWFVGKGMDRPTVLITPTPESKIEIGKLLKLDMLIDDAPSILQASLDRPGHGMRVYARDYAYNRHITISRVSDLETFMGIIDQAAKTEKIYVLKP